MKTEVARTGDSLSIRVPEAYVEALNLRPGQSVEIESVAGRLVVRTQPPTLEELLEGVTPENLHGEFDWGLPSARRSGDAGRVR